VLPDRSHQWARRKYDISPPFAPKRHAGVSLARSLGRRAQRSGSNFPHSWSLVGSTRRPVCFARLVDEPIG